MPTISVLMALFESPALVRQAIRSCLVQSFSDLELLVVDDASRDDSASAVLAFDDPRVHLLRAGSNGGPGRARNLALHAATGAWITVLDADDLYHPERLAVLLDSARELDPTSILFDRQVRWEVEGEPPTEWVNALPVPQQPTLEPVELAEWLRKRRGGRPFFARSLLELSGASYPAARAAEDTAFVVRLAADARATLVEVGASTYIYRRTPGSLVASTPARQSEAARVFADLAMEFPRPGQLSEALAARKDEALREASIAAVRAAKDDGRLLVAVRLLLRPRTLGPVLRRFPHRLRRRGKIVLRRSRHHRAARKAAA